MAIGMESNIPKRQQISFKQFAIFGQLIKKILHFNTNKKCDV